MRSLKALTLIAAALLVGGCWTLSIEPLYTEADPVSEPGLVGIWGDTSGSSDETWTFLATQDGAYRLITEERDAPDGVFEAHLVRLDGRLYLDLYPEEPEAGNEMYVGHLIPAHSIWQIRLEGHVLSMRMLDTDWLKDKIAQKEIDIAHVRRDDVIVLSASTAELQQFVVRYADAAFGEDPLVMQRRH